MQAEHSRSNDHRAGPLDTVCQGVAAAVGERRLGGILAVLAGVAPRPLKAGADAYVARCARRV